MTETPITTPVVQVLPFEVVGGLSLQPIQQ